jgi:serine/threonine-protein kinase HipA
MVLNALVSNTDDHPRNHALLARTRHWQLAPAYDLNPWPHSGTERDLAMTIGDHGRRASRTNLLSRCERFQMTRKEANSTIDTMKGIVNARWEAVVRRFGGSQGDCDAIRPAFDNAGFEY